jgi:hypothetical protein
VRTLAQDLDGDGSPDVVRTDVISASGIDPDEDGELRDVEVGAARIYAMDTTGDGNLDDISVEEIDIEVVTEEE